MREKNVRVRFDAQLEPTANTGSASKRLHETPIRSKRFQLRGKLTLRFPDTPVTDEGKLPKRVFEPEGVLS